MKLSNKKQIRALTYLLTLVYFASYVTRINFGTIMVEFIASEGVSKASASLITTIAFITYGTGQLLSGVLGDKFSPTRLMFFGLMASVSCNVILPFCSPNILIMTVIWGINGLAQAFMWPPIVKILSCALTDTDYGKSVAKICYGSAGGTLATFLVCPLIISASNWKVVFWVSALIGIVIALTWLVLSKRLLSGIEFITPKKVIETNVAIKTPLLKTMTVILPIVLISILMQGMLRDGISTWVPTFISETFNLGSEISILVSVVLPIFHVICTMFTYFVYKTLKNDVFLSIIVFFGGVSIILVLFKLFGGASIVLAILMLALINGFIHCVNALQTCYIPTYYKDSGKISTYSGILNFATYVGSAVSTYLFAKLSEIIGWDGTIVSWVIIGIIGTGLSVICYIATRKKQPL